MFNFLKRTMATLMIIALLISNVLTVTSAAFSAMLAGAISGVTGIKTLTHLNSEALDRQRMAVKRMGTRMIERTKTMIARSITSSSVKWIPMLGAPVALGLTLWEVSDLCDGLQDLDQLYDDMGIEEEAVPLDVCNAPAEP